MNDGVVASLLREVLFKQRILKDTSVDTHSIEDQIYDELSTHNVRSLEIKAQDYLRDTPFERHYSNLMKLTLYELFNNECAICRSYGRGVELDHFFLPKSKGGNFLLRTKQGAMLNNAIPLCINCNRRKQASSFSLVVSRDIASSIIRTNKLVNQRLKAL